MTKDTRIVTVREVRIKSANAFNAITRPAQAIKSRMLYQLSYGLHGAFPRVPLNPGQPLIRTNPIRA